MRQELEAAQSAGESAASAGRSTPLPSYAERYREHAAALAVGAVTAGQPYGLMFAGQRNIGGIGKEPGALPSHGVTTSDGWRYSFHSVKDAEAFSRRHAPRSTKTEWHREP